jgi:DNA-binding NarL/FixJ family response regulator
LAANGLSGEPRVVVADDSSFMRKLLAQALEKNGHEVVGAARDGAEAVALAAEHEPDLVLHGHAHGGTFQGQIGDVPVYNVSVPVMGQDFWVFELSGAGRAATAIH